MSVTFTAFACAVAAIISWEVSKRTNTGGMRRTSHVIDAEDFEETNTFSDAWIRKFSKHAPPMFFSGQNTIKGIEPKGFLGKGVKRYVKGKASTAVFFQPRVFGDCTDPRWKNGLIILNWPKFRDYGNELYDRKQFLQYTRVGDVMAKKQAELVKQQHINDYQEERNQNSAKKWKDALSFFNSDDKKVSRQGGAK